MIARAAAGESKGFDSAKELLSMTMRLVVAPEDVDPLRAIG